MEQQGQREDIFVIPDSMRKTILTVLRRATHPSVPFDQVNAVISNLEGLQPVQVLEGLPQESGTQPPTQTADAPQGPQEQGDPQ